MNDDEILQTINLLIASACSKLDEAISFMSQITNKDKRQEAVDDLANQFEALMAKHPNLRDK